jgi:UDPglucose--hexose-1-phosphate uridylyltransferase
MNAAIINVASEAFKQRVISKIPISPFFNVGRTAGGSQRRIHAQIYMDLNQDGHGARIDGILKSFENMRKRGECRMCNSSHEAGQRIVINEEDWTVFASGSPIRNYHLRFAPKKHIENIWDLKAPSFLSLSKILKTLFLALNDLKINENRNIVFNTKPYGYDSSFFHLFGDIYPFEFVGGAEMADDMRVVRISPKKFAKDLRETIKKNGYN